MLNMQTFHKKLLSVTTCKQDPYLSVLSAITKITPDKLNILASDLAWEPWDSAVTEPENI